MNLLMLPFLQGTTLGSAGWLYLYNRTWWKLSHMPPLGALDKLLPDHTLRLHPLGSKGFGSSLVY